MPLSNCNGCLQQMFCNTNFLTFGALWTRADCRCAERCNKHSLFLALADWLLLLLGSSWWHRSAAAAWNPHAASEPVGQVASYWSVGHLAAGWWRLWSLCNHHQQHQQLVESPVVFFFAPIRSRRMLWLSTLQLLQAAKTGARTKHCKLPQTSQRLTCCCYCSLCIFSPLNFIIIVIVISGVVGYDVFIVVATIILSILLLLHCMLH